MAGPIWRITGSPRCAPTLLIVGSDDDVVLGINRRAQSRLVCESRLAVVPGRDARLHRARALEAVAELARDWFTSHTAGHPRPAH